MVGRIMAVLVGSGMVHGFAVVVAVPMVSGLLYGQAGVTGTFRGTLDNGSGKGSEGNGYRNGNQCQLPEGWAQGNAERPHGMEHGRKKGCKSRRQVSPVPTPLPAEHP